MRAYWNNLSRVERESELDAIGRRAGFAYYQWDELVGFALRQWF